MTTKPRIILGLMTCGPEVDEDARIVGLEDFNKALDVFQARGYTELDTARSYVDGKQEAFTREANYKGRGLSIATKVYPWPAGIHKADAITEEFNTSLRELGTDCIDIAYLHAADRSVPFAETLEAMDKLYKAGKFKQLGLSNFTAFEVAEVVLTCKYNNWVRPTIFQARYSCIVRSIEAELIPACRRYGLDIVIYSPIAGGLLSGKILDKETIPSEGRYADESVRKTYWKDSTFDALRELKEAADKNGLTMIEIGLRWMMHHSKLNMKDGKDGIILGASSIAHLDSNLSDLEKGPLPEDVLQALDRAWMIAKVNTPNYWHLDLAYTYDTKKVLFGDSA